MAAVGPLDPDASRSADSRRWLTQDIVLLLLLLYDLFTNLPDRLIVQFTKHFRIQTILLTRGFKEKWLSTKLTPGSNPPS